MGFYSRSYQTLAPTPYGRLFGDLTLSHTFDDACNSAAAYTRSGEAPDAAYHLVYDGPGVSLNIAPQLVPVNLTRLGGSPELTGHYMVDIIPTHDGQDPSKHFVGLGRQTIPLTEYRDLETSDILGTASAPLLRVPLEALALHDVQNDVTPVAESLLPSASPSLATNVMPDTTGEPFFELLHRLDQRESSIRFWNTVPSSATSLSWRSNCAWGIRTDSFKTSNRCNWRRQRRWNHSASVTRKEDCCATKGVFARGG